MNLLDELDSFVSKECGVSLTEYRYVNIGGKFVYIEGHCGVLKVGDKEMSFKLKKNCINIKGEELMIKYFDKSTAVVKGRIVQVLVL